MDGSLGFYTILPDQMQVVNPLLILLFIPLFSYGVYPLLARCNLLKSSLQRMVVGGFLAAVAFLVSALISMKLEATYPELPSAGHAQVRIYNPLDCNLIISDLGDVDKNQITIASMNHRDYLDVVVNKNEPDNTVFSCGKIENQSFPIHLEDAKAIGIFFRKTNSGGIEVLNYTDSVDKPEDGLPRLR